ASEKKLAEQQRMENKRAGLDSKRAERQKQYDDWVSNARERQTIYETEAMASMAAFMYLTGTIMYKGMGIPNKDPYTVYTPQMGVTKFYVGIDLGYSGT